MKALWRVYHDDELKHLQQHGFRYELICKDIRTSEKMFIFINSNELQETIKTFKRS